MSLFTPLHTRSRSCQLKNNAHLVHKIHKFMYGFASIVCRCEFGFICTTRQQHRHLAHVLTTFYFSKCCFLIRHLMYSHVSDVSTYPSCCLFHLNLTQVKSSRAPYTISCIPMFPEFQPTLPTVVFHLNRRSSEGLRLRVPQRSNRLRCSARMVQQALLVELQNVEARSFYNVQHPRREMWSNKSHAAAGSRAKRRAVSRTRLKNGDTKIQYSLYPKVYRLHAALIENSTDTAPQQRSSTPWRTNRTLSAIEV